MKYNYIKSFFAVAVGISLLAATGCKKLEDFGNTDLRTDASSVPNSTALITNGLRQVGALFSSTAGGIRGSLYAQQWSETQYTDVSLYGNPQLDFGSYTGPLFDLQTAINLNKDSSTKALTSVVGTVTTPLGSNGNQIGIATIMKVYYLWTITDRWGDIPYSEALQAFGNLAPKFDKQSDIYPQMLADLKAANASFDDGQYVRGDIFFDPASVAASQRTDYQTGHWKKVANSMRMLIALRMSKVFPNAGDFAATEFADAANDPAGAIEVNADNLTEKYSGASAFETNVFYSTLVGRADYAFSKTIGDILSNMTDPRRSQYGSTGAEFPYGLPREQAVAFTASVSGAYSKPFKSSQITQSSSIVIIPAAYVLLAKAEAVLRGWIGGNAQTYYENGVTQSFLQWGLSATQASAYLSGPASFNSGSGGGNNIGFDPAYPSIVNADALTTAAGIQGQIERVQLQRYLASFGDGIQAWAEWRRTGVPNLTPTVFSQPQGSDIPRRLTYGTLEYGTNPAHTAEAA